jgi:hypothetical protein
MYVVWYLYTFYTRDDIPPSCSYEELTAAFSACGIIGEVRHVERVNSANVALLCPSALDVSISASSPLRVQLTGELSGQCISFAAATHDNTLVEDGTCLPSSSSVHSDVAAITIRNDLVPQPTKIELGSYLQSCVMYGTYQCAGKTAAGKRCKNRRRRIGNGMLPVFCHWHNDTDQRTALTQYEWWPSVEKEIALQKECDEQELPRSFSSMRIK